jgi:acetyltransferase-like isoleucine patch superfamily enzyme
VLSKVTSRLAYLRFAFSPPVWRWIVTKVDFLVSDHLLEFSRLRRPARATIHPSVNLSHAQNIHIGNSTRIQAGCVLWASPHSRIVIGDHTGLGPNTMIFASNHQVQAGIPYFEQPWIERDVIIGKDVWVGAGTIIVAGVTVGDGCVIGAGSVVTRDVPAGCIAAGVPAKIFRDRE